MVFWDITAPQQPSASADPSQCRFCHWWRHPYLSSPARADDRAMSTYTTGSCHRHAPVVAEAVQRRGIETVWPAVEGQSGCGDFERFRNPDGTPNLDCHA